MRNVLIDMTFITPESIAGVFVYVYRFIAGLKRIDHSGLEFFLLASKENEGVVSANCPNEKIIIWQNPKSKIPHLNGILHRQDIDAIIREYHINLFFSPFFSYESFIVSSVPHIAVIHDAQTFIIKRKQKIKGLAYRVIMKYLMSRISRFVTISNFSKKQISEITGLEKDRISVIYNCVEMADSQKLTKDFLEKPYILNVNTIQPYKNLETLVRAFAILKNSIDHNLVIKGKILPYWTDTIVPILKAEKLEERVFLLDENISSEQLTFLYEHADLFVSPSLMEGFGYTPIEAAICGVPVITTKETAIPETTMGLLHYYDNPKDYKELAKKIEELLATPKNRMDLKSISETYMQKYSIEVQAKSFCNLFHEVLQNG